MDDKITKTLMSKLRQPIHINYIASHILRVTEEETRTILNKLMEDGIIEESKYANDYYVIKSL
jgi:DNA-binding Lrp family transcriptional regulator